MANSMGQYPFNPIYNKDPRVFTGETGNAVGNAASDTIEGTKDNPVRTLGCIGAGLGVAKGVDMFVNSVTKGGDKSKFSQFMDRIDNNKALKPVSNGIDRFSGFISNRITGVKNYFNTSNGKKVFAKDFSEGYKKETMLAQPFMKSQLMKDLNDSVAGILEKTPHGNLIDKTPGGRKSFSEIIKHLQVNKVPTNLIESLKTNKEIIKINDKLSILNKGAGSLAKGAANGTICINSMFGGSGLGLINGLMLGLSIKSAVEAPKGEKTSTFMEDILGNWIGGFLGMIPVARGFNGLANVLEKNNAKTGIVKKCVAGIGKVMNFGHGVDFLKQGGLGSRLVKGKGMNGQWLYKGLPGGMMRLVVVGMIANAIFTKPLKKVSHVLFGKPTDPELIKKQKEQQAVLRQQQLMAGGQPQGYPNQNYPMPVQNQQNPMAAQQVQEPQRTYVPSPMPNPAIFGPQQPTTSNNADLNKTLAKTDRIMMNAEQVIGNGKSLPQGQKKRESK